MTPDLSYEQGGENRKAKIISRVFAEDRIMFGFGPTGYSEYQNGVGFETAYKK